MAFITLVFCYQDYNSKCFTVPGKPTGPLRCTNLTHNSVTLTWNPPADDGGAHITGYVIERLYSYHNALLESKHVNDRTTSCTFRNLKEDDRYAFRICAENKKGRSQHLETDEPVVPIRKKCKISTLVREKSISIDSNEVKLKLIT